jgi:deoxycytidylate deaminase
MKKILKVLIPLAKSTPFVQNSRHAAAIVYKNKILSTGICHLKTHPMMLKYQPNDKRIYLHAEIDAIIRTINNHGVDILKDCSLHVIRITKGGNLGMSKPCPGCQKAIEAFGIKKVYWSE